ncbi:HAD family hydrolase [Mediterraneibacter agrestimuris]|uniref:HAD family hydrolase n=1 Tax=Mediterraneibacter agrestimuris TaxID=2941333 RepID=UPI00203F02C0|nr:HAD family phosphatase [Mediterraneibacter agrestimuris]
MSIMKYKNIVFDYGNVLGTFNPVYILKQFCDSEEDFPMMYDALFENWQALDEGNADYKTCIQTALSKLPERVHPQAAAFYKDWYFHCQPILQTWEFVRELKKQNISVYLLSNASVYFADHALEVCEVLKEFDGIFFSGPAGCAKPDAKIYQMLFERFDLKPEECFFIDDNADNIQASQALGMDGIVFRGDVEAVKKAVGF